MGGEYLVLAGVVVVVGLLALAAGLAWWPAAARRRGLAAQARADYENARGTIHLRVLRAGQARAEAARQALAADLAAAQGRQEALKRERRQALVAALETHLAFNRFEVDVDGVGPVLAQRILEQAFHGRLADLTRASDYVEGIGAARQEAIDEWVQACRQQQPALLERNFPGKAEIMQRYAAPLAQAAADVQRLAAQQAANEERLARIQAASAGLAQVTVADFERALAEAQASPGAPSGEPNPALENYLRGVFPEWEPAPAWFAELSGTEGN